MIEVAIEVSKTIDVGVELNARPAVECPVGTVTNSDDTFSETVASGGTLVLDDVDNVDSDGSTVPTPAQTPFTCTPISGSNCAQLNAGLTETQLDFLHRVKPVRTFQSASYRTGDAWDVNFGRGVDFNTLTCNNPNGNTSRFETDTILGNAVIYDWQQRVMIQSAVNGDSTWNDAIDNGEALNWAGFTDWHLITFQIINGLLYSQGTSNSLLNYVPISINSSRLWTGDTVGGLTTHAWVFNASANSWDALGKTETFLTRSLYYRAL